MSDWVAHLDDASGYTYYQNNLTGETTWDKPEGFVEGTPVTEGDIPTWSEVLDPGTGHKYYYNNITGESSWEMPEGFNAEKSHELEKKMEEKIKKGGSLLGLPHNLALLCAARKVQSAYRAKKARKKMREMRAEKHAVEEEKKHGHHKWIMEHDKASGFDYYFNTETHESSWERPPDYDGPEPEPKEDLPKWVKMYDPNSVAYYYFNNFTNECMWDKPLDYVEPKKGAHHLAGMNPELKAALLIQNAYRAKQARRVLRQKTGLKDAQEHADKAEHGWITEHDEASGYDYYVHVETGEVTWEKPIELGGTKLPKWVKMYDPSSIAYYYYNNFTGEYEWDEPDDYIEPPKHSHHLVMNKELKAALCIQGAYRAKQARRVQRAKRAAAHAAEQVPVDGWVEQMDPHSGEYYYYNVDTGEQSWDIPEALGGDKVPTWVKVYDPTSVAYYYFNNFTQDCVWEEPEDYVEPTKKALAGHLAMSKELKAALCIQNAYRAKQARRVLRKKQGLHDAKEAINGWVTEHDKASGYDYYVHIETGEVTWDKPPEVDEVHKDRKRKKAETKKTRQVARNLGKDGSAITDLFKNDKQRQDFKKKLDRIKAEYYSDVKDQDEDAKQWVEVYDSGAEDFYYWNNVTGDVQWTQPHNYILAADDNFLKIVLKIQCVFRGKQGRIRAERKKLGILEEDKPKEPERELEEWEKWEETTDPNTGDVYYFHIETNEVAWEKPLSPAEIEAQEREEQAALKAQEEAEKNRESRMAEIKEQEQVMFQEAMREAKDKMALRLKRKEEKERAKQEILRKKAEEEKARIEAAIKVREEQRSKRIAKRKAKKEQHEKNRQAAQERQRKAKEAALAEAAAKAEKSRMKRLLERKQRQIKRDAENAKKAAEFSEKCIIWNEKIKEGIVKHDNDATAFSKIKSAQLEQLKAKIDSFNQAASDWRTLFEQGFSSIWAACRWPCSLEKTKELFKKAEENGYRPSDINKFGETTLQIACRFHRTEIIEYLIQEKKVPIDHRCVLGFTALFEAVSTGADKIVTILLKNGANPMLKDLHGDLPVHVASRNGQRIIVKQFLQHDRAVEMLSRKNGKNKRPLDLAKKLSCVIMLNKKEDDVQSYMKEEERKHRMMFLAPEMSDSDEEEEEEKKKDEGKEEKKGGEDTTSGGVNLDNVNSLDGLKKALNVA